MDIIARITFIVNKNYKDQRKESRFFELKKTADTYYWQEIFGERLLALDRDLLKPMFNFYEKDLKFKTDSYGFIMGWLFEDWHLSKLAIRYNKRGLNSKNYLYKH